MAPRAFRSQPLPSDVSPAVRRGLVDEHVREPFSAHDARHTARRAVGIVQRLGLEATVYRGTLDLDGSEVDHVWVDVKGRVVDVAFPLFVPSFVALLRRFVVGDAEAADLDEVAAPAGLDERVLGEFPSPLRYRGEPVWSARH